MVEIDMQEVCWEMKAAGLAEGKLDGDIRDLSLSLRSSGAI